MTSIGKRIASIVVAVCMLIPRVAGAETIELDLDVANKMTREVEACRERQKQLDALKSVGVLKDQRLENLKLQLAVTSSIAKEEREYAEILQDRLRESDSFWKSPVLWLAVGILVTGVSVGVGVGLSR